MKLNPRVVLSFIFKVTILILCISNPAIAQESRVALTLGYDFIKDSTVLGNRQGFVEEAGGVFEIGLLPPSCFTAPGITSIAGVEVRDSTQAKRKLQMFGLFYGYADLKCSDSVFRAPVYVALDETGLPTKLLKSLNSHAASILVELRLFYRNYLLDKDEIHERNGDCVVSKKVDGTDAHAFCVVEGVFVAAHLYNGDGLDSYYESRRDKFYKLIENKLDKTGTAYINGIPAVVVGLGPLNTETFVSDIVKYEKRASKFQLTMLELEVANIKQSLRTVDEILAELN